jgi:hypothetical protein
MKRILQSPWTAGVAAFLLSLILLRSTFGGATCRDGWASPSIGRPGACSYHGGVDRSKGALIMVVSLGIGAAAGAWVGNRRNAGPSVGPASPMIDPSKSVSMPPRAVDDAAPSRPTAASSDRADKQVPPKALPDRSGNKENDTTQTAGHEAVRRASGSSGWVAGDNGPAIQESFFDVTAIDDSRRYEAQSRWVAARDATEAGAVLLRALSFSRPGGKWRVASVVPPTEGHQESRAS